RGRGGASRRPGRRRVLGIGRRTSRRVARRGRKPDGRASLVCGRHARGARDRARGGAAPMILAWLIVIPLVAGALAWLGERQSARFCRWVALLALGADLALLTAIWLNAPAIDPTVRSGWLVEAARPWIPRFGIDFHVAMDGLGLLMVALTLFLGIVAVVCSWTEIRERVGFFHANLLWSIAGIVGVFVALDLFLFFFLWE